MYIIYGNLHKFSVIIPSILYVNKTINYKLFIPNIQYFNLWIEMIFSYKNLLNLLSRMSGGLSTNL